MFSLPDLPYAYDALEPVISGRTLHFHHDKHHATYVKTVNTLLEEAGKSPAALEEVIREAKSAGDKKLFNNAAQAWNHSFFWAVMSAQPAKPSSALASAVDGAFGNLEGLKKAFVTEGAGHFGSGWVWLVADLKGGLQVRSTHDAEDMVTQTELTPLLVCDLWEHAYYLDHQNDRKGYLEAWFDALPNWEFAAFQYAAAQGRGEAWRHPEALPATAKAQARAG
jgi:Fe-Mn family superoxide dismutase